MDNFDLKKYLAEGKLLKEAPKPYTDETRKGEVGNLAEEAGISIDDLIKTFNCSNARSYISQERFPKHILNEKYDGKSLIKNLQKDLNMIKKYSNTKNTSNNYITMTNYLLSNFDAKFANNDFTEIYKLWNENIKK